MMVSFMGVPKKRPRRAFVFNGSCNFENLIALRLLRIFPAYALTHQNPTNPGS